jgi:hypothetical protein
MRRMYDQMTAAPPNGAGMDQGMATEAIMERIKNTSSNEEFLQTLTE